MNYLLGSNELCSAFNKGSVFHVSNFSKMDCSQTPMHSGLDNFTKFGFNWDRKGTGSPVTARARDDSMLKFWFYGWFATVWVNLIIKRCEVTLIHNLHCFCFKSNWIVWRELVDGVLTARLIVESSFTDVIFGPLLSSCPCKSQILWRLSPHCVQFFLQPIFTQKWWSQNPLSFEEIILEFFHIFDHWPWHTKQTQLLKHESMNW